MVLTRWLGALGFALGFALAGAALAAGCSQSLFDNHGGGGPGGPGGDGGVPDGPVIPGRCTAPCIADAAADWDGSEGGKGGRWRYLDDHRTTRTWAAMTPAAGVMNGADARNNITSCTSGHQDLATCTALPGALLISSSGAMSSSDPAIEFKVPTPQVAQITLRVYVPGGDPQRIVLYRNSREDALFTGTAMVGKVLEQTLVLDALAKDRFLLAIAPTGFGASSIGVELFASGTGEVFPKACQLALEFDGASGNSIKDLCKGAGLDSRNYDNGTGTDTAAAISLMPGPFAELGMGIDLPTGRYLQGTQVLDQIHDHTVQFWKMQRNQDTVSASWAFSDLDLNNGGGLGTGIELKPEPDLDATTSLDAKANTYIDTDATIGGQGVWQFVRVVHAGGTLMVCLDGAMKASMPVPVGQLKTTIPPYLGKNALWAPAGAFYDGTIDDVRVFTGALPCAP